MRVVVLDYAVGNVYSIQVALRRLGAEVLLSSSPRDLVECDAIVLPGVGSYPAAAERLKPVARLLGELRGEKPILGICLGLQLLFEGSPEGGRWTRGLGFIRGVVEPLPPGVKRPHMGWNTVRRVGDSQLLDGLDEGYFYFAHSYYVRPSSGGVVRGVTEYGVEFASVVEDGAVMGTQFHPEKSGALGREVLSNFLAVARR